MRTIHPFTPTVDVDRTVTMNTLHLGPGERAEPVERLLADRWAEGRLEVLDGRVIVRLSVCASWQHRALYNVPRLAPFPEAMWDLLGDAAVQLDPVLARVVPGFSSVVRAVCVAYLSVGPGPVLGELTRIGRSMQTVQISGRRYETLRRLAVRR